MEIILIIIIAVIAIGTFLLIPLDADHPIKMEIISRLGLPTKTCNCGKTIPWSMRKCSQCKRKDFSDGIGAIAGLFGAAVGAAVLIGLVRAGFSILQGIDLASLSPELRKAIENASVDLTTLKSGSERLERADHLLSTGDKISVDQAAMLTCATLESGLKKLCERNHIEQHLGEKEGMVELSHRLTENGVISNEELWGLKNLVYKVRNPVMHGDFDRFNEFDVREQINFTRSFLRKYHLIS